MWKAFFFFFANECYESFQESLSRLRKKSPETNMSKKDGTKVKYCKWMDERTFLTKFSVFFFPFYDQLYG